MHCTLIWHVQLLFSILWVSLLFSLLFHSSSKNVLWFITLLLKCFFCESRQQTWGTWGEKIRFFFLSYKEQPLIWDYSSLKTLQFPHCSMSKSRLIGPWCHWCICLCSICHSWSFKSPKWNWHVSSGTIVTLFPIVLLKIWCPIFHQQQYVKGSILKPSPNCSIRI